MQYSHGGDIYSYAEQFGREALDFSANINPLGLPAPVRDAMHDAVESCVRYPDPFCRALRNALAAHWKLPAEHFFCANGAAEVFFRLADVLHPQNALLLAPTFGEYEAALSRTGCQLRFHTLRADEGFAVTERILDEISDDTASVWLCSPNNPTGRTIEPTLLSDILKRCQEIGAWLIVDECFGDFLTDAPLHTMRPMLHENDRLIIVRAFTKMYAIPGVRLGWCMYADAKLTDALHAAGQPWNVSSIAQAAGVAALGMHGFEEQVAQFVAMRRSKLAAELTQLGLRVIPSEVNYLLFETEYVDFGKALLPRGIMIRDCANYRGLKQGYFRVAIRGEQENKLLTAAMREVLN